MSCFHVPFCILQLTKRGIMITNEDYECYDSERVFIFVDVDGVLNDKYQGRPEPDVTDNDDDDDTAHYLDSELVTNLGTLVSCLARSSYEPQLVLSTTWRWNPAARRILLSTFAERTVEGHARDGRRRRSRSTLREYLYEYAGDDERDDATTTITPPWVTPDGRHGTSPEGRVAEIDSWLREYCRSLNVTRSDVLVLVLDDMDLLYTDAGKRNEKLYDVQFVCTVDRRASMRVEGAVGLTKERVTTAMRLVRQQDEDRRAKKEGSGKWTRDEWALIQANPTLRPHLQALRSKKCPPWIEDIAQRYVDRELKDTAVETGCLWRCCP